MVQSSVHLERLLTAADQPGQALFAGFEGTSCPGPLLDLIAAGRVGGVVLFARNVESPGQVLDLVRQLRAHEPDGAPLVVAIDQEGGRVQRLRAPWTVWPPMRRLGELGDAASSDGAPLDATAAVARALAVELRDCGIALDFAPVVDVDSNPANPVIGDRSFGRDPRQVAAHARAFIGAMQAERVACCAKHFPGHGDTTLDSHLALPKIAHDLDRLLAVELPPFAAAVETGVASVMSAHVVFEAIDAKRPATFSPDVIALLRERLRFDGLVFSDDLEMKAVADHWQPREMVDLALGAGVDALLACRSFELVTALLERLESLPDATIEPALRRVATLKRRFAQPLFEAADASTAGPPYPEHLALAARLSRTA
ncbi:MAG: beta-N-acetylhexosaminidase [Candidatus Binatia bacterium]